MGSCGGAGSPLEHQSGETRAAARASQPTAGALAGSSQMPRRSQASHSSGASNACFRVAVSLLITKLHSLEDLKHENSFSHKLEDWKSETGGLVGLLSVEASVLGFLIVSSSLCPHMIFPLSVSMS